MPFVGSIIPASVAGLGKDLRRARRQQDESREQMTADRVRRGADEAELAAPAEVPDLEKTERPPANESERSREDHAAALIQNRYTNKGATQRTPQQRIDVEG